MAMQQDEVGEIITIGGRTLRIVELARVRAERAEQAATGAEGRVTMWQGAATTERERRRQAEASASFWREEAVDLARQLRGYRRREWLMVALCTLVGALALALWFVAVWGA